MSGPPVMFSRMPVAPSIDASSSGEDTAVRAASAARFSPERDADPHQRRAGVAHDRAHVGEVEVDEAGHGDQVGDALHALAQDVVGHPEGVDDRRLLLDDLQQAVVLDHDQRVDLSRRFWMPRSACSARLRPSNDERPRDDADGERVELARDLGDDRARRRCRCRRPRPR